MNQLRAIERTNEAELALGITGAASWHAEFADSHYVYTGGLPYELNEGDILTVFSQYGVIEGIKLHRDPETGRSKGFCFLRYRDPRSCALAVDNFNGIDLLKRKIRVNHVKDYKHEEDMDVVAEKLKETEEEEDERRSRDKRKKEKREEARTVDLMRTAMSQNNEDKQRALEKERRRTERRQERSERRDEDRDDRSRSKRSKDREYDDKHLEARYRDVKDEYDREGDRHRREDRHEEDRHHRSHREPRD